MGEFNEKKTEYAERYRDLGCAIAYYRKRKGFTKKSLLKKLVSADNI